MHTSSILLNGNGRSVRRDIGRLHLFLIAINTRGNLPSTLLTCYYFCGPKVRRQISPKAYVMDETRYFYHSFPRRRDGEPQNKIIERGWAILQSIRRLGLILAPEIVEWRTPVSIGSPSPIQLLQQRICFTQLSRYELEEHSKCFGPFAIEFDAMALRRAGALLVIYMPQALSKEDHLALLGPLIVSHLDHIRHTLEQLKSLNQFKDPEYIQKHYPGANRMADDCMVMLKNGDELRGILQEFQVPWSAIRDFLSFLGFENAPFGAMVGAVSLAQSLFYPTDDEHIDERLGYYRQREWRITAGYSVSGISRYRILDEKQKKALTKLDRVFWKRKLNFSNETFCRVDKAVSLSQPSPESLLGMATRLIVPSDVTHEASQLFGDLVTEAPG